MTRDPQAGGLLLEVLHAVDGKIVALAVILLALAGFIAVLAIAPKTEALADPDQPAPSDARAAWIAANQPGAERPWSRS